MIEIKHKHTGEVILTVNADTLAGANLIGADLRSADLSGAKITSDGVDGLHRALGITIIKPDNEVTPAEESAYLSGGHNQYIAEF